MREVLTRTTWPLIRFSSVRTPIGKIFVGVTELGVFDLTFGIRSDVIYRSRLAQLALEVRRDDQALKFIIGEIDAYFSGDLKNFSIPVDLRTVTSFTSKVLRKAQKIRFGELVSYGELAASIGRTRASRAVGNALGRNPISLIIPCHRVVSHTGQIGGYTGGLKKKRLLLRLEGHIFDA